MFRGDLDAELTHYHPRGKAIVEAFVPRRERLHRRDRAHAVAAADRVQGARHHAGPLDPGRRHLASPGADRQPHRRSPPHARAEARERRRRCASSSTSRAASRCSRRTRRSTPDVSRQRARLYNAFRESRRVPTGGRRRGAPRRASGGVVPGSRLPPPDSRDGRGRTRATSAPTTGSSAAPRTQSTFPILANDPHRTQQRAVAALLGAPGGARLERHRRRRAGAARRVDRPQRARRLGPDDLRQRQRGSLRLRHRTPPTRTSTATRGGGSRCAILADTIPVKGEKPVTVELTLHAPRSGDLRGPAPIARRTRCAPAGWSRDPRLIWPACA